MGTVILHVQHSVHWLFDKNSLDFQYFSGRRFMSLWNHFNEISSSSRFEETVNAGWKWYISNILDVCNFFMALRRVKSQYYFMSWRVLAVNTYRDWGHKNSFMPLFVHLNTCCVEATTNMDTATEIYEYFCPFFISCNMNMHHSVLYLAMPEHKCIERSYLTVTRTSIQ